MEDLLIKVVETPDPRGRAWTSELWSGFPGSAGATRLAGGGVFTQSELESPGPGGEVLDKAAVLRKIREEDSEDEIFVEIGARLYELLDRTGTATEWRARRDAATASGAPDAGVRTYLDVPPSLAEWPWELLAWKDPLAPGQFDSAFKVPQHPVLRVSARPVPSLTWKDTAVRILLLSGQEQLDPKDPSARASEELRLIREAFHKSGRSVLVELCEVPANLTELENRITAVAPHVLHFLGHGNLDVSGTEFVIQFLGNTGGGWEWSTNQIKQFFSASQWKPRLVVLNSCHSSQRELNATPVATALLAAGVPAVVGAQAALQIDYARRFSKAFYGALAEGHPVDRAMVRARNDLSNAGQYGHKSRHWALPVLTVSGPAPEVLRLKRVDARFAYCEVARDVYTRPGRFVNRTADRWSLMSAFTPVSSSERFRGVILHSDATQVGKEWLVKRSLRDFTDAGFLVRYATLVGREGGRSSLDVLQEWRGRPGLSSPVLAPLPATHFAEFDQALADARKAADATSIERVFHTFKASLQSARQEKPVLLVLGRFRQRDFAWVSREDFREHLMAKLLSPIQANDPEVQGVHALLIARRHNDLPTGLPNDFDEFALQQLSMQVDETHQTPADGFRRHRVEEFARDQLENYLDEFAEFSTAAGLEGARVFMRAVVTGARWSPTELRNIELMTERLVKAGG
jgi:hypothetical protein